MSLDDSDNLSACVFTGEVVLCIGGDEYECIWRVCGWEVTKAGHASLAAMLARYDHGPGLRTTVGFGCTEKKPKRQQPSQCDAPFLLWWERLVCSGSRGFSHVVLLYYSFFFFKKKGIIRCFHFYFE